MSNYIRLVKYIIDDDIPVDDSSDNLESVFLPEKLNSWLREKKLLKELNIREESSDEPAIPITVIEDDEIGTIKEVLSFIETTIFSCIEKAGSLLNKELIKGNDINVELDDLYIWLKIRTILKDKSVKYIDNPEIKIVIE